MTQNKGAIFFGLLLILFGFLFLLNSLDLVDFGTSLGILWPVALIGVGLWFMLHHRRKGACSNPEEHRSTMQIFGDVEFTARGRVPERFSVATLFGDAKIDFTRGEFPHPTHYIDHSSVFGDLKIVVPTALSVSVSGNMVFGDIDLFGKKSGGFLGSLETTGGTTSDARKLVISANVVFGDVEVQTP